MCGPCDKGDHRYCDRPTPDDYYGKGPCSCQCNLGASVAWRNRCANRANRANKAVSSEVEAKHE
jgi:hypothetical protein